MYLLVFSDDFIEQELGLGTNATRPCLLLETIYDCLLFVRYIKIFRGHLVERILMVSAMLLVVIYRINAWNIYIGFRFIVSWKCSNIYWIILVWIFFIPFKIRIWTFDFTIWVCRRVDLALLNKHSRRLLVVLLHVFIKFSLWCCLEKVILFAPWFVMVLKLWNWYVWLFNFLVIDRFFLRGLAYKVHEFETRLLLKSDIIDWISYTIDSCVLLILLITGDYQLSWEITFVLLNLFMVLDGLCTFFKSVSLGQTLVKSKLLYLYKFFISLTCFLFFRLWCFCFLHVLLHWLSPIFKLDCACLPSENTRIFDNQVLSAFVLQTSKLYASRLGSHFSRALILKACPCLLRSCLELCYKFSLFSSGVFHVLSKLLDKWTLHLVVPVLLELCLDEILAWVYHGFVKLLLVLKLDFPCYPLSVTCAFNIIVYVLNHVFRTWEVCSSKNGFGSSSNAIGCNLIRFKAWHMRVCGHVWCDCVLFFSFWVYHRW